MNEVYICDALRTPFGRYGGCLSSLRADDLAALPIRALMDRNPGVDWAAVDDVLYGCANQAGEDNRDVARMALLLAGMPDAVPGGTLNRLCGSGLDALATAARAIRAGEADLIIAGGVESMSRAPFVMGKASSAFSRSARIEDTTIGWRFINPRMVQLHGTDSMPETAENLATDRGISREDQDLFALRSQQRTAAAQAAGRFGDELIPVEIPQKRGEPLRITADEHPRPETTLEGLTKLKAITRPDGTITAGNSSGVNDGAGALLVASEAAMARHGLTPLARIVGGAVAGVPPRIMGIGPAPAVRKVLERTGLALSDIDLMELNEAFAAQGLAVLRDLGLPDDADFVNPNGGAIAARPPARRLGRPARGNRRASNEAQRRQPGHLPPMCIGVGQGIAAS